MKDLQETKATQETKELLESLNITGDDAVMYRFDSAESLLDFLDEDDEDDEDDEAETESEELIK